MTLFDYEYAPNKNSNLTPRDWKFYDYLKRCAELGTTYPSQEMLLEFYEDWLTKNELDCKYSYGYYREKALGKHYSNMSSARAMRKTIERLRNDDTIQKVICTGKLANTVDEAELYLERKKTKALKMLKSYWHELKKLEKHHQVRFTNGKQRDYIQAVVEENESS